MKSTAKTILSLVLIIIFLISCFALISVGYFGFWLHTYNALTAKTAVAEVTISESKKDDKGQYADVKLKPLQTRSALDTLVNTNANLQNAQDTKDYKLYGDTIYLGAPIIKFKDGLILLNFQTIYRLGKVYARYDFDNQKEINRTPEIASTYDLNGGYADWKAVQDNYTADGLLGNIYRSFVDSVQVSSAGVFVENKPEKYMVYMTNTGLLWEVEK